MHSSKRKESVPPRSTCSAPVLGSKAASLLTPWVSLTQVPKDWSSAHYSATPSPTTSLGFDSCLEWNAGNSGGSPSAKKRGGRDRASSVGTEPPRRLPGHADVTTIRKAMALLSALLVGACLIGALITIGRLFTWTKDSGDEGARSTAEFIAESEAATENVRDLDTQPGIDGELDSIGGDPEIADRAGERTAEENSRPSARKGVDRSSRPLSPGNSGEHLVGHATAQEPRIGAGPEGNVRGVIIISTDENTPPTAKPYKG
ncbi:hypothetical protein MTO96_024587 [Rhipicephalus appendiculatus]